LLFNKPEILKDKTVLEIGCGAGRFTEHILKYAKLCVSVDFSSSIYFNIKKNNKKLILVKADFTKLQKNQKKFDVVICRGVLQHTPNPLSSIIKLYEFTDQNSKIYFDIYPRPKIGFLHPKYLIWRPFFKTFIKYETLDKFLDRNIRLLLVIKRLIRKICFSDFISDSLLPIWDYKNKINLNDIQLQEWSKLDTLDGLYAEYDKPKSYKEIKKFLKENKIKIINSDNKENCFETDIN